MTSNGPTLSERKALHNSNQLKIGLFGVNCSAGRAITRIPEAWSGNWEDCLSLARAADDAGVDFLLPIARWKGYKGEMNYQGATLETVTWAAGLLASTKRITVFATVHAPLFNPLIAAKEFVTADHIGRGRFGLNIVCGWNEDEFRMFNVEQREHDLRYEHAQEWLDILKKVWSHKEPFDFDGQYVKVKEAIGDPKPYGGARPIIMNAGSSPVGRAYAIRNCDALFTSPVHGSIEKTAEKVQAAKQEAAAQGNDLDVYTIGLVFCRKTKKEAEEYHHYALYENADWSTIDAMLRRRKMTPETVGEAEFKKQRDLYARGLGASGGGQLMVGDPDHVAGELIKMGQAGLRGVGLSMVNYGAELPFFCAEILPRLERAGLRAPLRR